MDKDQLAGVDGANLERFESFSEDTTKDEIVSKGLFRYDDSIYYEDLGEDCSIFDQAQVHDINAHLGIEHVPQSLSDLLFLLHLGRKPFCFRPGRAFCIERSRSSSRFCRSSNLLTKRSMGSGRWAYYGLIARSGHIGIDQEFRLVHGRRSLPRQ